MYQEGQTKQTVHRIIHTLMKIDECWILSAFTIAVSITAALIFGRENALEGTIWLMTGTASTIATVSLFSGIYAWLKYSWLKSNNKPAHPSEAQRALTLITVGLIGFTIIGIATLPTLIVRLIFQ